MKNQTFLNILSDSTLEEIPALLNKIRSNYENIPSYQRGAFNQLVGEFREPPNNFQFSTWKSRLKVFVSGLDFEIGSVYNTNIVVGNGNTVTQGSNHGTVINNFGVSGLDYGKDKEIKGLESVIGILIQKKTFLLEEYATANGKYKFSLEMDIVGVKNDLEKYKSEIQSLAGTSHPLYITVNNSLNDFKESASESEKSNQRPSRQSNTKYKSLEKLFNDLEKAIGTETVVYTGQIACNEFLKELNMNSDTAKLVVEIESQFASLDRMLLRAKGQEESDPIYELIDEQAEKLLELYKDRNKVVKVTKIDYPTEIERLLKKLDSKTKDSAERCYINSLNDAKGSLHILEDDSKERSDKFVIMLNSLLAEVNTFLNKGYDFKSL